MATKEGQVEREEQKRLSLFPLTLTDAVRELLNAKPEECRSRKKGRDEENKSGGGESNPK